jgi:hypothetical protein
MIKTPRPAAPGRAHRAGTLEFLGGSSNPRLSRIDATTLAAALRAGTALRIGPRNEDSIERCEIESTLQAELSDVSEGEIESYSFPFACCCHFFKFIGRSSLYNHRYPASRLQRIIAACFGLSVEEVPAPVVFVALKYRALFVKQVTVQKPFDWIGKIRSVASIGCTGRGRAIELPLIELAVCGSLPPILMAAR